MALVLSFVGAGLTVDPEGGQLLGAVMINPDTYFEVAQFLRAEDFYIHRHQWIWEAFVRLNERRDAEGSGAAGPGGPGAGG